MTACIPPPRCNRSAPITSTRFSARPGKCPCCRKWPWPASTATSNSCAANGRPTVAPGKPSASGAASSAPVASGDSDGLGVNLGSSYRLSEQWRLGLALGLQEQTLEVGEADSEYDLRSYLLSAFAQYQQGRLWADASLSLGHLDYSDLNRQFALGIAQRSEKGDSDGQLWALSGRLGYDLANADTGWRVSPFISADYAEVDVDAYREDGASATALNFADQQRDSARLGLGLQANYQLAPATQVFAEIARELEFEDDRRDLRMGLNSVAGNSFELQGHTPASGQTLVGLGVSHALAEELQLRAAYQFRGTDDRQHGVNLSLNWDW